MKFTRKHAVLVASAGLLAIAYVMITSGTGKITFGSFNKTYFTSLNNLTAMALDSKVNGTVYSLQDLNATIYVFKNGTVNTNISSDTNNSNAVMLYLYNHVAWKFTCINSLYLNTPICPNTYPDKNASPDFSQQYTDAIRTLATSAQKNQYVLYPSILMDINGKNGTILAYDYKSNPKDIDVYNSLNGGNLIIPQDFSELISESIDYGTSGCLTVEIPKWSIVAINITTERDIINYTIPPEYLKNSDIGHNLISVTYLPYPNSHSIIKVEVCS